MAETSSSPAWRSTVIPMLRGCVVLALVTLAAYRLHLNAAVTSCAYLVAIVLNCLDGAVKTAGALSLAAVGCLDFFFIEPRFSFTMDDPMDYAALVAFLTVSMVTTRLASRVRDGAAAAKRDHGNLQRLYDLAQQLLMLDPLRTDHSKILDTLRSMVQLRAAAIFDAGNAQIYCAGDGGVLGDRTRDAYIMSKDINDPESGIAIRCFRSGGKATGAIGFLGLDDMDGLAGPVAALVSATLQRGQASREAANATAEARMETLRSAILDALAHEFKTPLAAILTAAGGLREIGRLGPEESELAEIVETEAERLTRLSSRLLRLARLDVEEVRPRLEPADIVHLVNGMVARYARRSPDREFPVVITEQPPEVAADPELLQLALSQLLDNACKYSPRDSPVRITVEPAGRFVHVTVWNCGDPISPTECRLIFDRFYRGSEGRLLASGSGLGLYVARKIALAHGGSLELDPSAASGSGVAFRLSVPLALEEFETDG
jgi:two-component system sensor histidine kinase KdpD